MILRNRLTVYYTGGFFAKVSGKIQRENCYENRALTQLHNEFRAVLSEFKNLAFDTEICGKPNVFVFDLFETEKAIYVFVLFGKILSYSFKSNATHFLLNQNKSYVFYSLSMIIT